VESSQGDVSSAEGEAALASSSSNAHLDKPVLLQDREVEGDSGAEAIKRAVIYVGEDVTAHRSVVRVIPLYLGVPQSPLHLQ